jgi:putative serine protease PepD
VTFVTPGQHEPRRATRSRAWWLGGGVFVAALAVTIALLASHVGSDSGAHAAKRPSATPSPSKSPTVADVYKRVEPSVTVVRTSRGALGTGVVAADNGTIVTADHVIAGGGAITVLFADGTKSAARVMSADRKTDIATLIPATLPQPLVPATIGGGAAAGDEVIAIGNPLGLAFSVSSGVVSGLDRTADTSEGKFSGLIQFDASVNPGSSGGPLVDAAGNVVGIVVSIADPGRDDAFAGIGFAVPIGAAIGGGGSGAGNGPQK